MEAWINMPTLPTSGNYYVIAGKYSSSGNSLFFLVNNSSGTLQLHIGGISVTIVGNFPFSANVWYHVAAVRSGSTATLYVNGSPVGSGTFTENIVVSGVTYRIGVIQSTASSTFFGYFNGYISNHRLVKGAAVYTSSFTPPTGALQAISGTSILTCRYPTIVDGSTNNFTITNVNTVTVNTANPFPTSVLPNPALGNAGNGIYTMSQYASLLGAGTWPAIDPYYENVTLNLHGNAGTVLPFNTDASTNNFQVTQVGNTGPSNYTPFIANGYWSNYFDGSGDYITAPSNAVFDFGSGDFTIEMWVNPPSHPSETLPISRVYDGSGNYSFAAYFTNGTVRFLYNGLTTISTSTVLSLNTWSHVAYVRNGTTLTIYVNGVSAGSGTISGSITASSYAVGVGARYDGSFPFVGWISNARIVKGTAVYTSAFTPSTTPLTAISGTSLLTCQSNRFIDNSTNAFTITPNGNVAVNPLQPFTAPTGTSAYGSGYFDGTGDWLTPPTGQTALTLGTSDFTIEMWAYPTTQVRGNPSLFASDPGIGLANAILIQFGGTTGQTMLWVNNTNLTASATNNYIRLNQWNHIAICRSGGNTYTFYINGVAVNSVATNSTSLTTSSWYLGYWTVADNAYTGYLSNFRIVKGTVVYTGAFTPPTSPLTAITNTSLLTMQTNASSQNNTFLDSSTNNFVITRAGNTTQGTFTPYGANWSNLLPNTTGSCLRFGTSTNLALGSGDFTVEMWVYINALASAGYSTILDWRTNGFTPANIPLFGDNNNNGKLAFIYGNGGGGFIQVLESSTTMPLNAWTHIALVRSGTTVTLYFNGTSVASATSSVNFGNETLSLGQPQTTGPYTPNAYFSNVRIVKGSAVYTGSFTPPTAPLTAVTNTQLLTCQSNRFVDNSSNNFTVTIATTPSVQRFSPFSPSTAYSTSVIGGSGYFDGSGDFLSFATNQAPLLLGSSDFTFEAWVYRSSGTGTATVFCGQSDLNTVAGSGYVFYVSSSASSDLYIGGTGYGISSPNPSVGAWAHVAWVRTGGVYSTYLNGARVATRSDLGTGSVNNGATTYAPSLGAFSNGGSPLTGYIADARLIKGSGGYNAASSTITIPTAPLTAVSNTSLLLSYTNAGILDNAMMNDLETVGNAQLSTSVKKYGSASIYCDGSGDYVVQPTNVSYGYGTGDFTIEFWLYLNGTALQTIFSNLTSGSSTNPHLYLSTTLRYYTANADRITGATLSAGQWYHIALCRASGSTRLFVNGNQSGSTYADSNNYGTSAPLGIGTYWNSGTPEPSNTLNGYIDDLRITKGVARYTTSFTPPTSQVQDQ
jgi:hypothetical protein